MFVDTGSDVITLHEIRPIFAFAASSWWVLETTMLASLITNYDKEDDSGPVTQQNLYLMQ